MPIFGQKISIKGQISLKILSAEIIFVTLVAEMSRKWAQFSVGGVNRLSHFRNICLEQVRDSWCHLGKRELSLAPKL